MFSRVFLAVFVALPACAEAPPAPDWVPTVLTAQEAEEGFYPLFNGKDLDGWRFRGPNKQAFEAKDGLLVVNGADDGDWLFTEAEYENFVLRFEYRLPRGGANSGVGIRATKEGDPAFTGMEIQVVTPTEEPSWNTAGALYSTVAPAVAADNPVGVWNFVEVTCDGDRIRTLMNGRKLYDILITDYAEPGEGELEWRKPLTGRARSGHIAVQNHGDSLVYRNIRIKPLPGGEGFRPLFNGRNLDGWTPMGDAKWFVRNGTMTFDPSEMTERSGLRTDEAFGDFELRLSFRPEEQANSGVFFRGSGDDPWPRSYEVQIDNHSPDQWTGAIWDQVPASELRAMDGCWSHMRIVARGPMIQVAVNGKVVVDYFSTRHEEHPSGWICLQAHDPGSVVAFRDIEIKELSAE